MSRDRLRSKRSAAKSCSRFATGKKFDPADQIQAENAPAGAFQNLAEQTQRGEIA